MEIDLVTISFVLAGLFFVLWLIVVYRKGPTDPVKSAQDMHQRTNIHQPAIVSKLQVGRYKASAEAMGAKTSAITAHTNLSHQDTQAQIADMASTRELLETPIRLERMTEAEALGHQVRMEATESELHLLRQATEQGNRVETQQVLNLEKGKSRIMTGEALELARIEIEKTRQMKAVELQNTLEEMRERVRLAIIADYLTEHQKIQLILEQADLLYQQIQGIEQNPNLNEITKRRMINDREEFLLTLKEDRRGREDRLLQTGNRQDNRQVGQDTNLRGDYRQAIEAGEE